MPLSRNRSQVQDTVNRMSTATGDEERHVLSTQRTWAESKAHPLTANRQYLADPATALRAPLMSETEAELKAGAGDELKRLHSLRSSTCLAINVFEAWCATPGPVGQVLQAVTPVNSLEFESQQPTGLEGKPPHLDVLLRSPGPAVGIECKFVEPYDGAINGFRESYLRDGDLWSRIPSAGRLARRIADGSERFEWLGAAQLLKHALGLSVEQPAPVQLRLVWYRVPGSIADELDEEIGRFASAITDFSFAAMTYQELVHRLRAFDEPAPGYFEYLNDRYGLSPRP